MCSAHVKFFLVTILVGLVYSADPSTTTVASTAQSSESTASSKSTESTTQHTSSTIAAGMPVCDELSVMENIDILRISGTWYELARKGYGTYIQDLQCLQMDISYMNGNAWVYQTFATSLSTLGEKSTYEYIVQYDTTNISDYHIQYTNYAYLPTPSFKILDTDYENYLLVCSYISVWKVSAAAFVYFRDRSTSDNEVYAVINNATAKYVDFNDMNLVYQGPRCFSGSQALSINLMTVFFFLIYSYKFINW